jgi:hypothetical protein
MVERGRRDDMFTMFRVMAGMDSVDSTLWFDMANQREGATSTRQDKGQCMWTSISQQCCWSAKTEIGAAVFYQNSELNCSFKLIGAKKVQKSLPLS